MSEFDFTPENADTVVGDIVAMLAADHRGDETGRDAVAAGLTPMRAAAMAATALGMVSRLGARLYGEDRWIEMLSTWQPGDRLDGLA